MHNIQYFSLGIKRCYQSLPLSMLDAKLLAEMYRSDYKSSTAVQTLL